MTTPRKSAAAPSFVAPLPPPAPLPEVQERSAVSLLQTTDSTRLVLYCGMGAIGGGALGFAVWWWSGSAGAAGLVGAVLALAVFSAFYLTDIFILSGYAHRRLEVHASTDLARSAMDVNAAQAEQIEQLWEAVFQLEDRVSALGTITITDRDGTRQVPRTDQTDIAVRRWLTSAIFDETGRLVGVHGNGQLAKAYPFKGDSDEARAGHSRLTAAGLVGWNGRNYTYIGPANLQQALSKLAGFEGRTVPEVD